MEDLNFSDNGFDLDRDGVLIIPDALDSGEVAKWISTIELHLANDSDAIKNRMGAVYAARNLVASIPGLSTIWNRPVIRELLVSALGQDFGLVRGLYFDKHPERSWSLPWHKDMTIAVKDNSLSSDHFTKPTNKSGVPHVEAAESVLSNMLTLRVHLDDVTDENGPLEVVPGSHHHGKQSTDNHVSTKILARAGSVLAMRPLVSHASGSSRPGTPRHRRILHLEFAGDRELPDGYKWYEFQNFAL